MKEEVKQKNILIDSLIQTESLENTIKTLSEENKRHVTFFEQAPVAFWIEDFSKAKLYIHKIADENNTDVTSYIFSNPNIISKLASLVKVKDVNTTAVDLYNAKSKEYLLANLRKIFTKKSNEGFSKLVVDILIGKKETEVETVNRTIDGKEFDVAIKFKVIEGSEKTLENVIVSVENITERIKARQALSDSENRYKESQAVANIGSWYYDYETNDLKWSEEAYKMLGLEPNKHNLSVEFYLSFVHKDDKKLVKDFSIKSLLKKPTQKIQYRIITKNGELKYINEKRTATIENNRIVRVVGIGQDITDSVLAEQRLNTTKNLLSNTLSSIGDGFVILDHNSNYIFVNQKAADLLGKKASEIVGKCIWTEFPEKKGDLFYDNYQKALKTRKSISFENYFEPWDRWFKNRIIPSNDGILIFFHETTDKKKTENKIKLAYNIINKSSSVAILCKNEWDFPVVFASENTINLFGYNYTEFLSNKLQIHKLVHPSDLDYIRTEVFKLKSSKNFNNFKSKPFRIITKNGEEKWVQASFDAIRNDQNEITHIQGIVDDITERKKAEDLFFESNQRFVDQFNNTPLASIIWDLDFNVIEWNNSAQRIFGYSVEEAKGKNTKDLITPPHLISEMKKVLGDLISEKGGNRNTNENVTKCGKIITCDWYNVTLKDSEGNVTGVASLVDDITGKISSKKLLEKSEKKYRDIFEKSIDAVLVIKNGVFVDCNESTLKMFGYNKKQTLLKIHPSFISPENQPDGSSSFIKAEEMINIALEKGSNRFRWFHKKKNGEVFPAEVTLTRIDDTKLTIHAVVIDISERVKKEKLENVLYNISKAALAINNFEEFGFFIKNELHKIIDTSNFYIALYNEKTNLITTPVFVDEMDEIQEFPAKNTLTGYVIKTKKPLMVNKESHAKLIEKGEVGLIGAETKIWVGVPLKLQDKVFGAIVVQSYVNKNAYNENDMQLLEFVANQISTTIQRKKSENELKKALIKAQESDRLKSAFLSNMSHEIRTPMNGIIGFSELFLDSNLSKRDIQKYANIVIKSSKQLLSIVNDILDISKIEAGVVKLNYEKVNINRLLDDLYVFFNPIAKENKLHLSCTKGLENYKSVIEIDKTKLNQVLTNLLSNAFKFTDKGSVKFGYELVKDKLQFYVKDSGVGIEKKLQSKIFDRFIQADFDLNKRHKGTGLGLAISKKFIELFNGEIWLDSSRKGTTISFTIPYLKAEIPLISTVIEEQKPISQVKNIEITILVAEDEEYNMMYINELFSKTNFKIIEANNGKQAIELSKKYPEIDLILMDIKMPIMNGIEAMSEIKKSRPTLPIIALSAFALESDKQKALNKGFDAYLTKPLDKKLLFNVISKHAK